MYVNFNRAYPRINSRDFRKRARPNWDYLKQEKTDESENSYAAWLFQYHKTKRHEPYKFNIFLLWLYLCHVRPWENNWQFPLNKEIFNAIYDTAKKVLKDSELLQTEIGTLKYHLKKKNLKTIVERNAIDPKYRKLVELFGKKFFESTKKFALFTRKLQKVSNWKLMIKFASILESDKHVRKSDLMKRLRIDKKLFDFELKEAENQGFIKIKKYSDGATFIVYIDPENL